LAPHIINALSFGGNRCVEYQTAGYMLLAQLSALRQLDVSFVHAALQALTRSIDAEAASVAALSKPLLCVVRGSLWSNKAGAEVSFFFSFVFFRSLCANLRIWQLCLARR
jgi:hypothetical protein